VAWAGHWGTDPSVWVGCALALAAYPFLPGARRDRRGLAWTAGVLVLLIALESAIDQVGDTALFSVHMAQHLILAMVAPPLLIRGLPDATVDAILRGPVGNGVRVLVHPLVAATLYFVVLIGWHIPVFFDYALTHDPVHIAQHLSFIAVGLCFWWAVVIHREGEPWNLGALGEVAYLTAGALPSVVVGLSLALVAHPVYSFYLDRSIRLGLSPLADQRLGGLLMFGFDNLLMVGVAGYYLWRLLPPDGSDVVGDATT